MKKFVVIVLICCVLACAVGCNSNQYLDSLQTPFFIVPITTNSDSLPTPSTPLDTTPASPAQSPDSATPTAIQISPSDVSLEDYVAYLMQSMSLEEKVGQLLMFGFTGTDTMDETFKSVFSEYFVGNIILFGHNIRPGDSDGGFLRASRLVASVQSGFELPMLVSIDVEGGGVRRFSWDRAIYSANALGEFNDSEIAYEQFKYIGEKLYNSGINMNLAPCVDISESPMDTFLGSRIISSSLDVVTRISSACIRGMHQSSCLSVAKHFPGHGGTNEDSHATTPIVNKTLDELMAYDIAPYYAAINAGVDGVLVAHILYPEIDPENIASMSRIFITQILREQLGFDGVVISDDFRMRGMLNHYSLAEAGVQFILAGGDLIICGAVARYQSQIAQGLLDAVASGHISLKRLDESVSRIIAAKLKYVNFMPLSD